MRVLDLFSGTGGWSQAFLNRGHEVTRLDNDPQFTDVPYTLIRDVLTWEPYSFFPEGYDVDVILASPPCQAFSLAATGTHMTAYAICRDCGTLIRKKHEAWQGCGCIAARPRTGTLHLEPKTDFGKLSVALVERTLELVEQLKPRYWWMENPNGGMIHFVPDDIPRVQVTYCQYGEQRQKLTNLWGVWPGTFDVDKKASKGKARNIWENIDGIGWVPRPRCENGADCHETSRRGDKTGTQGIKGAKDRAIVPYQLSGEVCAAIERAMEAG